MSDVLRPGSPSGPLALLRLASVRQGGVYLASRFANGVLALLQLVLVTEAVGPSDAGRYFLLWTAAWLLSVVVKFGSDGIVPRAVAEARLAGGDVVSVRRVCAAGALGAALLLAPVMAVLGVPLGPLEVVLVCGLALVWGAIGVLAALLKAHGRADLSGLVGNVLWPLAPVAAAVVAMATGSDWQGIALLTLVASLASLGISVAVTVRGLGTAPVAHLLGAGGSVVPVERDEVGAAVLTTLYEVVIWLPVLLGGLLGLDPEQAAGLFAATRIAGLFSWGYQAVLTVLVSRIATAFAAADAAGARRALRVGSLAGIALTWPLCVLGVVLAGPLLDLLSSVYDEWAGVLMLLIAARAVDAATGPLGEALLVGRRTWVDVAFVLSGVAVAALAVETLQGPSGNIAVGIGAAAGFVLVNLLRLSYVGFMLRDIERRALPGAGALG